MPSFQTDLVTTYGGPADHLDAHDRIHAFLNTLVDDVGIVDATFFDKYSRHFDFEQTTPANRWVIDHDLDREPNVSVKNAAGQELLVSKEFPTRSQVVINFNRPLIGTAHLS